MIFWLTWLYIDSKTLLFLSYLCRLRTLLLLKSNSCWVLFQWLYIFDSLSILLTAFLCSVTRLFNSLPVSPMYCASHDLYFIWYIISFLSRSEILSFGWHNFDFSVFVGLFPNCMVSLTCWLVPKFLWCMVLKYSVLFPWIHCDYLPNYYSLYFQIFCGMIWWYFCCIHWFQIFFSALTVNEERNFLKPRFFFIFLPKRENSFIIELYSFIIEIKVVRNVILNNIDLYDQPSRMHRSSFRSRQKISDKKNSKNR